MKQDRIDLSGVFSRKYWRFSW